MSSETIRNLAVETNHLGYKLKPESVRHLGAMAINLEKGLGINDPLTYLARYLETNNENGEIEQDLISDIAERLPETPFVNYVNFIFDGHDFISEKDRVSMRSMTENNLKIFKDKASSGSLIMLQELKRAKTESQEADKLAGWLPNAPIGSFLVFESLPFGEQKIAISRIYRKASPDKIESGFVSLYNPTIDRFNTLRKLLNTNAKPGDNEEELLTNNYEFYDINITNSSDFIEIYKDVYDKVLEDETGIKHKYGIEKHHLHKKQNGIEKVKNQTKLTSVFTNVLKIIVDGKGMMTDELFNITHRLGIRHGVPKQKAISLNSARNIINDVLQKITCVIDRADEKILSDIELFDIDNNASYDAMIVYGEQASKSGVVYNSNGCPEYTPNNKEEESSGNTKESVILDLAFHNRELPDNFGEPKFDLCRILNCPSRGELSWLPKRTIVGGCSICINCHHLFEMKKEPKKFYKDQESLKEKVA